MTEVPKHTKQLPLRLSADVHARLLVTARAEGLSAQKLIERAIARELQMATARQWSQTTLADADREAYRFMLAAPVPFVIKDVPDGRIVWANLCYRDLLGAPLESLRSKTVGDLGVLSWERAAVERDIQDAMNAAIGEHSWCLEPILVSGSKRLFGTIRFAFRTETQPHRFLGDVSFDWSSILPGAKPVAPTLIERMNTDELPSGVDKLFRPFLHHCPTAIAIKDGGTGALVFVNKVYSRLVGKRAEAILGRTTQEVFQLSDSHPMIHSDATVIATNSWMYTYDTVTKAGPRVSLRFPIPGPDGVPSQVGVISTTIGTNEHPLVFAGRLLRPGTRADRASRRRK